MKKAKKMLSLLLVPLLLGGCTMKANYEMGITEKKEMNLSLKVGFDRELIEALGSMSGEDLSSKTNEELLEYMESNDSDDSDDSSSTSIDTEELSKSGFTVKKVYDTDDFIGYEANLKIDNIDSLVNNGDEITLENIKDIKNRTVFTKNGDTYTLSIKNDEDTSSYSSYISSGLVIETKFILTLPEKSASNNATTVSEDGKTLTWDLTKATSIEAKFNVSTNIINKIINYLKENIIILVAIIAIIIIIILIIILSLTKKKPQVVMPTNQVNQNINPTNNVVNTTAEINNPPIDLMAPDVNANNITENIQNTVNVPSQQMQETIIQETFVPQEEIVSEQENKVQNTVNIPSQQMQETINQETFVPQEETNTAQENTVENITIDNTVNAFNMNPNSNNSNNNESM